MENNTTPEFGKIHKKRFSIIIDAERIQKYDKLREILGIKTNAKALDAAVDIVTKMSELQKELSLSHYQWEKLLGKYSLKVY